PLVLVGLLGPGGLGLQSLAGRVERESILREPDVPTLTDIPEAVDRAGRGAGATRDRVRRYVAHPDVVQEVDVAVVEFETAIRENPPLQDVGVRDAPVPECILVVGQGALATERDVAVLLLVAQQVPVVEVLIDPLDRQAVVPVRGLGDGPIEPGGRGPLRVEGTECLVVVELRDPHGALEPVQRGLLLRREDRGRVRLAADVRDPLAATAHRLRLAAADGSLKLIPGGPAAATAAGPEGHGPSLSALIVSLYDPAPQGLNPSTPGARATPACSRSGWG